MTGTKAVHRYAKAILELADSKKKAKEINADMALIATTINANKDLDEYIQNPTISPENKEKALNEIFSGINELTKQFFRLLFANKRFEILEAIAQKYNTLFDELEGIETSHVITATPMDKSLEEKLLEKIRTISKSKIILKNTVDSSIIGGFIIRLADKEYNASIANKLQLLKRELSN